MDSNDTEIVSIGTALAPFEDDEARKKPVRPQDQVVRDEQGRIRFHGAFTGGFSAGYYNTVGTKEGWTPSTFKSSRKKKANYDSQRPEDYMDDSDLGEFGFAPREIATAAKFGNKKEAESNKRKLANLGGPLPDLSSISDLISPTSSTMGYRLLTRMGWREGQGIGPKIHRKIKSKKLADTEKVYGCCLPPTGEMEPEEDEIGEGLMFAPKDVTPVPLDPKDNLNGLGYKGIDSGAVNKFDLFDAPAITKGGRKGITGQAFGVGALNPEDEDDKDVYARDHLSNYDYELKEDDDVTVGWTAPKDKRKLALTDGREKERLEVEKALEGFHIASNRLAPKPFYPPPVVPRDYVPRWRRHMMAGEQESAAAPQGEAKRNRWDQGKRLTADDRAEMLGETPKIKSVFDILTQENRDRIEAVKQIPAASFTKQYAEKQLKKMFTSTKGESLVKDTTVLHVTGSKVKTDETETKTPEVEKSRDAPPEKLASNEELRKQKLPLFLGAPMTSAAGFRPFATDPAKQDRYDRYVALLKSGSSDAYEEVTCALMTDWERAREKEEFMRSAQLYKPLSSVMSARFVPQEHKEDSHLVEPPEVTKESDLEKAVKEKKFGKLTRCFEEWHPHRNLCKRFNVPNPFPQSTIVGLTTVKRDKFSIFNFLTVPNETEVKKEAQKALPTSEMTPTQKKNVNIFACLENPDSKVLKPITDAEDTDKPSTSTACETADNEADLNDVTPERMDEADDANMVATVEIPDGVELRDNKDYGDDVIEDSADQSPERPPMDLFKAIFASSDEDEENDDEAGKEDDNVTADAVDEDGAGKRSAEDEPMEAEDTPVPSRDQDATTNETSPEPIAPVVTSQSSGVRIFQANTVDAMKAVEQFEMPAKITFRRKEDRFQAISAAKKEESQTTPTTQVESVLAPPLSIPQPKSLLHNVQWEKPQTAEAQPNEAQAAAPISPEGPQVYFPTSSSKFAAKATESMPAPMIDVTSQHRRKQRSRDDEWVEKPRTIVISSGSDSEKKQKKHKNKKKHKHKKKQKRKKKESESSSAEEGERLPKVKAEEANGEDDVTQKLMSKLKDMKGRRVTASDFW